MEIGKTRIEAGPVTPCTTATWMEGRHTPRGPEAAGVATPPRASAFRW
jgi:hypothetical protein